jgi:hypothetical protein
MSGATFHCRKSDTITGNETGASNFLVLALAAAPGGVASR